MLKLKQQLIAAAILSLGFAATAAPNYFVVTPTLSQGGGAGGQGGDTGDSAPQIALNAGTLPDGSKGEPYSFDFKTLTSVSGGTGGIADAVYSIGGGSIPTGLSLSSNGVISGTPSAGTPGQGQSFTVNGSYQGVDGQQVYIIKVKTAAGGSGCLDLLQKQPGTPSGWHELDIDGPGPLPPKQYYCDMESDGGGWTRVVRQTEQEPVAWEGGQNGQAYALPAQEIPTHTQVGFGRDENATFVDYVNFIYLTGNIPASLVASPKTGGQYIVHRHHSQYYGNHDPKNGQPNNTGDATGTWAQTLTFKRITEPDYGWTFSQLHEIQAYRGYRMGLGGALPSSDSYAWTVWVR